MRVQLKYLIKYFKVNYSRRKAVNTFVCYLFIVCEIKLYYKILLHSMFKAVLRISLGPKQFTSVNNHSNFFRGIVHVIKYLDVIKNTNFPISFHNNFVCLCVELSQLLSKLFFSFQCMLKILFCTCFSIFKNYVQKDLKNGFSKSARYSDCYLK